MSYLDALDRCPNCEAYLNSLDIELDRCLKCEAILHIGKTPEEEPDSVDVSGVHRRYILGKAGDIRKHLVFLRQEVILGLERKAVRIHTALRRIWSGLSKEDQFWFVEDVPSLARTILYPGSPVLLEEQGLEELISYLEIFEMMRKEE